MNKIRAARTNAEKHNVSPIVRVVRSSEELRLHLLEDKAEDDMNRWMLGMPNREYKLRHGRNLECSG